MTTGRFAMNYCSTLGHDMAEQKFNRSQQLIRRNDEWKKEPEETPKKCKIILQQRASPPNVQLSLKPIELSV